MFRSRSPQSDHIITRIASAFDKFRKDMDRPVWDNFEISAG